MARHSSTYALDRRTWEGCQTLSTQPGWASKPLTHLTGGGQGAALKPKGALGLYPVAPGLWERGLRERGSHTGESP